MAKIRRPKRGRQGSARLDLTDLAHVLRDTRQWTALGRVIVPDGETSHFTIDEDDGEILVEVELQPEQVEVTAKLSAGTGSVWEVPPVGAEVAVIIPSGEMAFMPIITAVLSTPPDGVAESVVIIASPSVVIHAGPDAAQALELAYKKDVARVVAAIKESPTLPNDGGAAYKAAMSLHLDGASPPNPDGATPTGTSVLKAQ